MRIKYIILIILIIVLIIAAVLLYPWTSLWFGLSIMPNPPKPSVTIGEFDFELIYERDGDIVAINDKATCEFDGYNTRTEAGQSRKWRITTSQNTSIQDESEEDSLFITLVDLSKENEYDEFGHKILELYFYGVIGYNYMFDYLGDHNRDEQNFYYISYRYKTVDGSIGHSSIPADEAYEKYKIRLISWNASPPIENEFK